jgi:hypothetical protein
VFTLIASAKPIIHSDLALPRCRSCPFGPRGIYAPRFSMPADQCLPSSSRPYIDLKIRLPSLHESLGKVEDQQSGKLAKTAQLLNKTGGGGTGPRPHIAACTPEVGHCGTRWHWPGIENREIEDCRMCEAMFRFGHMRNCGRSETHTGRNTSRPKSVSNWKVNESGPGITHVDYTPAYCDPFKAERRLDNLFRIIVPGGSRTPKVRSTGGF